MSFSSVLFAFDANHTIGIRPFKDREHSLRIISLAFGRSKQNREIVENHIVGIWMADHQHYDLELLPLASSLGSVWPPNKEARCPPENLAGEG